ncbi:MAG: hypothetical protein JXA30_02445 [Deltaproteobacteria bacterium]|nr:hypothetical protein [Deltaproteobacteria bacterium]
MRRETIYLIGLCFLFSYMGVGCYEEYDDALANEEQAEITDWESAEGSDISANQSTLVATLETEPDHTVEFHDFGKGALIVETGPAYAESLFEKAGVGRNDVVTIWKKMTSKKPVPPALVELQQRLKKRGENSGSQAEPESTPIVEAGSVQFPEPTAEESISRRDGIARGVQPLTAVCNNGCCDWDWLNTFNECRDNWDYGWFLFTAGYSWANVYDIAWFRGLVCSAVGTSRWKAKMSDGIGITKDIPEARFMRWGWSAGYDAIFCAGTCAEDLKSSVNTSSTPHLHTYCGYTQKDW